MIELWQHQKDAVDRARVKDTFGLFFEPGCGKTLTAITILREKYNYGKRIIPTLIVTPLITLYNWKEEWIKFSKIPEDRVLVLLGSTDKRIKQIEKAYNKYGPNLIMITNYEGLVASKNFFNTIKNCGIEALVLDECHKIKSGSSKRTKVCVELSDLCKYKLIMTGTPILKNPMDIFWQFRAMDGGKTFGKSFFVFRATYFKDVNAGMPRNIYFPNWVLHKERVEELTNKIYQNAMRVLKKDCLDLPPLVKKTIYTSLSPVQTKLYNEMKEEFVAYLGSQAVVAELAMTKALRLQQILTGVLKFDDGRENVLHDIPRVNALKDILENIANDHKVIVWSVFKSNYAQIRKVCEDLKLKYVEAHGETPNKQKFENVELFNTDEDTRVFIGHPGSLGIGINLIAASYSVYFSRNFSLENDIQSEARNYRGGSEIHEKITRIDLVTKDTIDELVLQAINSKQKIADYILENKERI